MKFKVLVEKVAKVSPKHPLACAVQPTGVGIE